MDKVFLSYVFFFGITRTGLGLPVLTCNDVDPMSASSLRCTCHNPGGPGIEWYRDGTYLTQCTQLDGTCFPSGGYTFAADSATFTYTIDVNTYSYTDCSNISCSDLTATSDIELKTILVDESNLNSTNLTIGEPSASHTNGYINFTTDCLYKSGSTKISVSAKWTAVTEKGNHTLEVDDTISEIGSCQSCRNDFASKYFIEFYHKEDQTKDKQEAHILLELFIDGNPVSSENSMTNNMYYVRGQNNNSVSNTVSRTLSPTKVTSITDAGSNQSTNPTSLSSVSIQRESSTLTTVSVPNEGKPIKSYVIFIIVGACVVLISFTALFSYYIVLQRSKSLKIEIQPGRLHQGQNRKNADESETTVNNEENQSDIRLDSVILSF